MLYLLCEMMTRWDISLLEIASLADYLAQATVLSKFWFNHCPSQGLGSLLNWATFSVKQKLELHAIQLKGCDALGFHSLCFDYFRRLLPWTRVQLGKPDWTTAKQRRQILFQQYVLWFDDTVLLPVSPWNSPNRSLIWAWPNTTK